MTRCELCGKPILSNDKTVWKQVIGWVGGPKKDSMRLRDDTGKFAHDDCVKKIQAGQALDQPSMFDEQVDTGPIVVGKTWQEVMENDNCL